MSSTPELVRDASQQQEVGSGSSRRHWSDWTGCLVYIALAADVLVNSPRIGIMLLPIVVHELLVAFSFLVRRPVTQSSRGWMPRFAAYCGTFLMLVFIRLSSAFQPDWVAPSRSPTLIATGMTLWVMGSLFGIYSMWHFRHAFSLIPQARLLVTSGPFRIARHPIYLAYLFQYLGIFLTHMSFQFALVLTCWAWIMSVRVKYEEAVLTAAFPEYSEYRRQVNAIVPKFPRRTILRHPL